MSGSVNKVILVGNLGRDPEMRTFPSGDVICNARLATTDRWKDKASGEMREHTEWHSLVFNGRLAEIAGQYLRKGASIYVEGSLRTRKWQDQSGNDRYSTEVRVDSMQMLGSRQDGQGGQGQGQGGRQGNERGGNQAYSDQGRQRGQGQGGQGYSNDTRQQGNQGQGQQRAQQPQNHGGGQGHGNHVPSGQGYGEARPASGFDDMDDDIPF